MTLGAERPVTVPIRGAAGADAAAIAAIYNHYVRETTVTFEETAVAAEDMAARMAAVADAGLPWLAANDGAVLGYAYATPWKPRVGYRFAVEITVYVAAGFGGRGIGSALYRELFARLEAHGVHAVIGGIALPNDASVALHEACGMRKVAHFAEVGRKFGRWIDVGYWQRNLEPSARRGTG